MIAGEQRRSDTAYPSRIRDIELRVTQMEAVLKGIAEEIADLRSVVKEYVARESEPSPRLFVEEQGAGAAPVRPLPTTEAAPAVQKESPMVMIMQPDGTLKPERRVRSDYVITH